MADLEHDIRRWTDQAVRGVAPVSASEAMGAGRRASRRGWLAGSAAAAIAVVAVVAALAHGAPSPPATVVAAADPGAPTTASATSTAPPLTTATTASSAPVTATLQGTYAGTGTYSITDRACTDVSDNWTATITLTAGDPLHLTNSTCGTNSADDTFTSDGTFTLSASDGSTISGTSHTSVPRTAGGGPIAFAVTAGTGRYAGLTGNCELDNRFTDTSFGHQDHHGTIRCELGAGVAPAPVPTTVAPTTIPPVTFRSDGRVVVVGADGSIVTTVAPITDPRAAVP